MSNPLPHRLTRLAVMSAVVAAAAAGGAAFEGHASSAAPTSATGSTSSGQNGGALGNHDGTGNGSSDDGGYGAYGGYGRGSSGSAAPPLAPPTQATASETVGVVDILTTVDYGAGQAAGTGIVLTSSGRVLTNNHVIAGATSITATDLTTGRRYTAKVVGTSATNDISVLQLAGASALRTAPLGDSSTLRVGDTVTAVGNADNAPGTAAATGTVEALDQAITASAVGGDGSGAERVTGLIETTADVQAGDSGGPLLDTSGHVVGIDTAAQTSRRGGVTTAGFAIPIDHATAIADQIVAGVSNASIQQGLPAFLGVDLLPDGVSGAQSATTIEGVLPGSAAAAAGLVPGDSITSIGGASVSSQSQVQDAISSRHPGDRVTITWIDPEGATHRASVTLGSGPAD